jgi:dihydroflavonol-4-reductase
MLCLVTGATGFVGSAVARKLLAAGHQVRVLVREGSDRRNLAGLDVTETVGSLSDPATLPPAVDGVEALFHVAADYRLWVPEPDQMYRANVDGTLALMEAALEAGVRRIVHTSSVATLGLNADGSDADETTPVTLDDMVGPYKRSKYLSEEAVRRLVAERGLPAIIVNPSTPVGPRDIKPTPTGRLIVEAASGRMPAYVDTGLNFAHVDDVADGHLLAFERGVPGERYILGAENLTLAQVLAIVCPLAGLKPPVIRLPAGLILPLAYAAEAVSHFTGKEPFVTVDGVKLSRKKMFFSIAKAREALGYAPRPAAEGFADAVAWFREKGYLG